MKVGDFYPRNRLPQELVPYLSNPVQFFYVPTEVVVTNPLDLFKEPLKHGRICNTDLVTRNGEVGHWRKFANDGHSEHVLLCEVWTDTGDDGHTDYRIAGYRLCKQEDLDKKAEFSTLPEVAALSDTDYTAFKQAEQEDYDAYRKENGI